MPRLTSPDGKISARAAGRVASSPKLSSCGDLNRVDDRTHGFHNRIRHTDTLALCVQDQKDTLMPKPDTLLYTRKGCHLCEVAHAELLKHGLTPELIDIDKDPDLVERYTDVVPVVWIDGRERFRGHVNTVLLRRLLRSN